MAGFLTQAPPIGPVRPGPVTREKLRPTAEEFRDIGQAESYLGQTGAPVDPTAEYLYDLAGVTLEMGIPIGLGILSRSPAVAYAAMSVPAFGHGHENAIAEGRGEEWALVDGLANVAIEVGTERLFKVFDFLGGGKRFKGKWFKKLNDLEKGAGTASATALLEGFQEIFAEGLGIGYEKGVHGGREDIEDAETFLKALGYAGLLGVGAGYTIGATAGTAARGIANQELKKKQELLLKAIEAGERARAEVLAAEIAIDVGKTSLQAREASFTPDPYEVSPESVLGRISQQLPAGTPVGAPIEVDQGPTPLQFGAPLPERATPQEVLGEDTQYRDVSEPPPVSLVPLREAQARVDALNIEDVIDRISQRLTDERDIDMLAELERPRYRLNQDTQEWLEDNTARDRELRDWLMQLDHWNELDLLEQNPPAFTDRVTRDQLKEWDAWAEEVGTRPTPFEIEGLDETGGTQEYSEEARSLVQNINPNLVTYKDGKTGKWELDAIDPDTNMIAVSWRGTVQGKPARVAWEFPIDAPQAEATRRFREGVWVKEGRTRRKRPPPKEFLRQVSQAANQLLRPTMGQRDRSPSASGWRRSEGELAPALTEGAVQRRGAGEGRLVRRQEVRGDRRLPEEEKQRLIDEAGVEGAEEALQRQGRYADIVRNSMENPADMDAPRLRSDAGETITIIEAEALEAIDNGTATLERAIQVLPEGATRVLEIRPQGGGRRYGVFIVDQSGAKLTEEVKLGDYGPVLTAEATVRLKERVMLDEGTVKPVRQGDAWAALEAKLAQAEWQRGGPGGKFVRYAEEELPDGGYVSIQETTTDSREGHGQRRRTYFLGSQRVSKARAQMELGEVEQQRVGAKAQPTIDAAIEAIRAEARKTPALEPPPKKSELPGAKEKRRDSRTTIMRGDVAGKVWSGTEALTQQERDARDRALAEQAGREREKEKDRIESIEDLREAEERSQADRAEGARVPLQEERGGEAQDPDKFPLESVEELEEQQAADWSYSDYNTATATMSLEEKGKMLQLYTTNQKKINRAIDWLRNYADQRSGRQLEDVGDTGTTSMVGGTNIGAWLTPKGNQQLSRARKVLEALFAAHPTYLETAERFGGPEGKLPRDFHRELDQFAELLHTLRLMFKAEKVAGKPVPIYQSIPNQKDLIEIYGAVGTAVFGRAQEARRKQFQKALDAAIAAKNEIPDTARKDLVAAAQIFRDEFGMDNLEAVDSAIYFMYGIDLSTPAIKGLAEDMDMAEVRPTIIRYRNAAVENLANIPESTEYETWTVDEVVPANVAAAGLRLSREFDKLAQQEKTRQAAERATEENLRAAERSKVAEAEEEVVEEAPEPTQPERVYEPEERRQATETAWRTSAAVQSGAMEQLELDIPKLPKWKDSKVISLNTGAIESVFGIKVAETKPIGIEEETLSALIKNSMLYSTNVANVIMNRGTPSEQRLRFSEIEKAGEATEVDSETAEVMSRTVPLENANPTNEAVFVGARAADSVGARRTGVLHIIPKYLSRFGGVVRDARRVAREMEIAKGKIAWQMERAKNEWARAKKALRDAGWKRFNAQQDRIITSYLEGSTNLDALEATYGSRIPQAALDPLNKLAIHIQEITTLAWSAGAYGDAPRTVLAVRAGTPYLHHSAKHAQSTLNQIEALKKELGAIARVAWGLPQSKEELAKLPFGKLLRIYQDTSHNLWDRHRFTRTLARDEGYAGERGERQLVFLSPDGQETVIGGLKGGKVTPKTALIEKDTLVDLLAETLPTTKDYENAAQTIAADMVTILEQDAGGGRSRGVGPAQSILKRRDLMLPHRAQIGQVLKSLKKNPGGNTEMHQLMHDHLNAEGTHDQYLELTFPEFRNTFIQKFPVARETVDKHYARYQIRQAFRDAINEITDPETVILDTMDKLATHSAMSTMLTNILRMGTEMGWASLDSKAGPGWVPLAPKESYLGSASFAIPDTTKDPDIPLKGKSEGPLTGKHGYDIYVPAEIAEAFRGWAQIDLELGGSGMRTLHVLSGLTKVNLVILNFEGQIRNMGSSTLIHHTRFALAGGNQKWAKSIAGLWGNGLALDLIKIAASPVSKRAALWEAMPEDRKLLWQEIVERGIMFDGGQSGAVYDVLKEGTGATRSDAGVGKVVADTADFLAAKTGVGSPVADALQHNRPWHIVKEKGNNVFNLFAESFRLTDELIKVIGYPRALTEWLDLAGHDPRLAEKYFGEGRKSLSEEELGVMKRASEYAANAVLDAYPTFSRNNKFIKMVSRWPVIGAFPGFAAQMMVTTKNMQRDFATLMISKAKGGMTLPDGTPVAEGKQAKAAALFGTRAMMAGTVFSTVSAGAAHMLFSALEQSLNLLPEGDDDNEEISKFRQGLNAIGIMRTGESKRQRQLASLLEPYMRNQLVAPVSIDPEAGTLTTTSISYLSPVGAYEDGFMGYWQDVNEAILNGDERYIEARWEAFVDNAWPIILSQEPFFQDVSKRLARTPRSKVDDTVLEDLANWVDSKISEDVSDEMADVANWAGAIAGASIEDILAPRLFQNAQDMASWAGELYDNYADNGEEPHREVSALLGSLAASLVGAKTNTREWERIKKVMKGNLRQLGSSTITLKRKLKDKDINSYEDFRSDFLAYSAERKAAFDWAHISLNTASRWFGRTPSEIAADLPDRAGGMSYWNILHGEYTAPTPTEFYDYLEIGKERDDLSDTLTEEERMQRHDWYMRLMREEGTSYEFRGHEWYDR
jgi:hypothetical protein